tara:strand:+ start:104 stop:904 length:801 start_codon:yes stop_codon:yes gene_type:complete
VVLKKINLAFIGCGAMCKQIISSIIKDMNNKFNIEFILDNHLDEAKTFCDDLNISPHISNDFNNLIKSEHIDLVIETASVQSVKDYSLKIVEKFDLMIASVGALSDDNLYNKLLEKSSFHGSKLLIPHGAIGGLDAISAVKEMINNISITTTKSPQSLKGSKGFEKYEKYKFIKSKTIFDGTAKKAIELFPKNLNVAVTLSLYGIGTEKTNVVLIVDPKLETNNHSIFVEGDFGQMKFDFSLNQSPTNPKTSALAALSLIKGLKDY